MSSSRPRVWTIGLAVGTAVLVAFAIWCGWTVLAVDRLRDDLEEHVGWLAQLHEAKAAVAESHGAGPARAAGEGLATLADALTRRRGPLDPLAERLHATSREVRAIADARDDGNRTMEDEQAVLSRLEETVPMIREETAAISVALASRWRAMYIIAATAVLLSFAMLALLAYLRLVVLPRVDSDTERLHRLAQRLAQSELAAHGVAGELNNPLTAVVTNLQLLAERLRGPHHTPVAATSDLHLIEDALQGIARMSGTVQDLRGSASGPDHPAAFDPNAMVDAALTASRFQTGDALQVSLALQRVPEAHAPEGLVKGVVEELLMAGLVAVGDAGGTEGLSVRTSNAGPRAVALEIEVPARALAGLDVRAFERRLEIVGGRFTTTPQGGRVRVRIELPTVPLAVSRAAPSAPPASVSGTASPVERLRILLVDDDELVRTSVKRVLARHDVTTESDGEAAIPRILESDWDLVLCDLMMPGKSGMDVFHEVVARKPELGPRFVFISGGASTADAEKFLEEHAASRLDKPFGTDALRKLVAEAAKRRATKN